MLTHFWPDESTKKYVNEAKEVFSKVIAAKEKQIIDFPQIKRIEEDMR